MSVIQNEGQTRVDLDLAADLVKQALAQGADEVEVLLTQSVNFECKVRRGEVERLSESQPQAISLRVYKNKQGAVTYTSDFNREGLDKLVRDALELASIAEPDPANGLPDPAELATSLATTNNLRLYDPMVGDLPPEIKIEMARRAEDASFANPCITNSNGATFGSRVYQIGLVNSLGFAGSYQGSACSLYMGAVADDQDGKKQTDGWNSQSHFFKELETPEQIGQKAAERTLRLVGARKVPTRKVPVVWESEIAGQFLGALLGAVNGMSVYRRNSFLLGREGQQLGSSLLNIVDDPLLPGKPGSRPFDGEGIVSRRNPIFSQGVFNQFLFNTYAARKAGRRSTGNASPAIGSFPGVGGSNFYLAAGQTSPAEIIAGVQDGLYLTDLMSFGINLVTGDLSQGAVGIWIENGQLAYPVCEINISGNLKDMLRNLVQIGNDLEFRDSVASPTLRIDDIVVSGL